MTLTIDETEMIEQAGDIGQRLGFEAAYQRGVPDPDQCLALYDEDYSDWEDEYGPTYAPLSGKSGGLTERQLRQELGLTSSTDSDLLDSVFDKFEESFYQGWYDEILDIAKLNHVGAAA